MIIKFQNINNESKMIEETKISFNAKVAQEYMIEGQKKYHRIISSKQITPIVMSKILQLYAQKTPISKIATIVDFSCKAIRNNLVKAKITKVHYLDFAKFYGKKVRYSRIQTIYSLKHWCQNWIHNSANKSYVWTKSSLLKYQTFLRWSSSFENPFGIKLSSDVILYFWKKYLKENNINNAKTPTKQTIYNWIAKGKYNFNKRMFLKLSRNLHNKNVIKRKRRTYDDFSKSILDFQDDMKGKDLINAYELDLVKGKRSDPFAILTCINKKTRIAYAKKVKPNACDVKTKLLEIIEENNLQIDQLIIDNGSENVLLYEIKSIKQIYRCRPYCSSDKAQIENVHRILRYWIPKGKSINSIQQRDLDEIMNKINNYPRSIYENGKLMSAIEFANTF